MFMGIKKNRNIFQRFWHDVTGRAQLDAEKIETLNERREALRELRGVMKEIHDEIAQATENNPLYDDWAKDSLEALAEKCEDVHVSEIGDGLQRDIATATQEIIARHNNEFVDWGYYQDVCETAPRVANLWREYFENFDSEVSEMAAYMLDEDKNRPQVSHDGEYYIGPMMGSRNSFPIAIKEYADDDEDCTTPIDVKYSIGCFDGSKEELLERIQAKHGDNEHAQNYRAFIAEAEKILLPPEVLAKKNDIRLDPAI